jgi:hypothetical protein
MWVTYVPGGASILLHKIPGIQYVKHKLVKNTLPSHQVKHDDTQVPPKCRRARKQAANHHPVWFDLSLKWMLSVEFVELSPQIPMKLSKLHTSFWAPRLGTAQALILCCLISFSHNLIFGTCWRVFWRRGCRVECARFGLRVCEWSTGIHAACTGDVVGKQASKDPHDAGLDKHCTLQISGDYDWLWWGAKFNLVAWDASRRRWCLECLGMCLCQPYSTHTWHTSGIRLVIQ